MKFLLVIPALMLFLSNIPFVHKMDMKEMMAAMKQKGCCKKQADEDKACHAKMQEPAQTESCHDGGKAPAPFHGAATPDEQKPCGPKDGSCELPDACVCIYLFQYAAPDQVAAKLLFGFAGSKNNLAGYLQLHWKDPHLKAPWQPPDMI